MRLAGCKISIGKEGERKRETERQKEMNLFLINCRTSIEDLKREHEQDKHHLLSMHRQEMEVLKAAHSHTR